MYISIHIFVVLFISLQECSLFTMVTLQKWIKVNFLKFLLPQFLPIGLIPEQKYTTVTWFSPLFPCNILKRFQLHWPMLFPYVYYTYAFERLIETRIPSRPLMQQGLAHSTNGNRLLLCVFVFIPPLLKIEKSFYFMIH